MGRERKKHRMTQNNQHREGKKNKTHTHRGSEESKQNKKSETLKRKDILK